MDSSPALLKRIVAFCILFSLSHRLLRPVHTDSPLAQLFGIEPVSDVLRIVTLLMSVTLASLILAVVEYRDKLSVLLFLRCLPR
jgi:hypothetical protein